VFIEIRALSCQVRLLRARRGLPSILPDPVERFPGRTAVGISDQDVLVDDAIGSSFAEITDRMELARHGAHSFWGLLTRTAATIAAHTLLRTYLATA
jgi:hypothetical protein